jgi:hypothetical protein
VFLWCVQFIGHKTVHTDKWSRKHKIRSVSLPCLFLLCTCHDCLLIHLRIAIHTLPLLKRPWAAS